MRRIQLRELHLVAVESESFHHRESEIHAGLDFAFDLIWPAEDMRVILRKAADPQQSMKDSSALIAINRAEFGESQRQFAVTAQMGLVDENVARTIHRLDLIVCLLDFDGTEHVGAIKAGMAAGLPQIQPHHMRSENQIVTAVLELVAQPVFHQAPN